MDIRFMERKQLEKRIKEIEENIFAGKEIDIKEFYLLKKILLRERLVGSIFIFFLLFSLKLSKLLENNSIFINTDKDRIIFFTIFILFIIDTLF